MSTAKRPGRIVAAPEHFLSESDIRDVQRGRRDFLARSFAVAAATAKLRARKSRRPRCTSRMSDSERKCSGAATMRPGRLAVLIDHRVEGRAPNIIVF